jgi:secreted PhoX family phosphatase
MRSAATARSPVRNGSSTGASTSASTSPAIRTSRIASAGWSRSIPSIPRHAVKRTALGRKRQESATCTTSKDGRVVVYMGDDARFEYIYKFVSRDKVRPGTDAAARAANRHLLDEGTLYVARYDAGGRGRWLELRARPQRRRRSQRLRRPGRSADPCAPGGDIVGGTKMDRPEWIAVHPGERRGVRHPHQQQPARRRRQARARCGQSAGRQPLRRHPALARGRRRRGEHRLRLGPLRAGRRPRAGRAAARAIPSADADMFGSPDGLHFDSGGLLWIQTDMSGQVIGKPAWRRWATTRCCAPTRPPAASSAS